MSLEGTQIVSSDYWAPAWNQARTEALRRRNPISRWKRKRRILSEIQRTRHAEHNRLNDSIPSEAALERARARLGVTTSAQPETR